MKILIFLNFPSLLERIYHGTVLSLRVQVFSIIIYTP